MKKHLVCYGNITDPLYPLLEMEGWKYWQRRLQFWKWRLHHTMGRPVLVLWRKRGEDE